MEEIKDMIRKWSYDSISYGEKYIDNKVPRFMINMIYSFISFQ